MALLFEDIPDAEPAALASVLVPYPVDRAYTYALPDGMEAKPGHYVIAPLGGRETPGVVWDDAADTVPPKKLKSVIALCDAPPMPEIHRRFIDWVAQYTMTPKGAVLKMSLSVPAALEKPEGIKGYKLRTPSPQRGEGRGEGTFHKPDAGQISFARALRQNHSEAERKLWDRLRDRQLEGYKFKRQHPLPPYIADFACLERHLVVELDGPHHEEQKEYDAERTKVLQSYGFKVIRFENESLLTDMEGALGRIVEAARTPSPRPSPRRGEGEGREKLFRNLSPIHRSIITILSDGVARRPKDIAEQAGCSTAVIQTLVKKGLLEPIEITPPPPCAHPDPDRPGPNLSPAQAAAAQHMREALKKGGFHAALLDGVTGAGKTEVYFEAMAEALKQNKQVLLLLPEIALSNAFLDRFRERFGCRPALWHSALTPAQRRNTWRGVAEGQTKVVIGARSALFLPYADLGLIVVDEEHDPAYKQEDNVIYHARDMAVARAHLGKIPILLVSATPSLETMANAWAGRYTHLHLPDRHGGATLPDVHIVDMKLDKPERQHFISPTIRKAVEETLKAGEQSLLFLNRRGYAPLTLCRTCGHRMECPRCTAWLVEHKKNSKLQCHHCGYATAIPKACPSCNDTNSFAACGPGVERVLEEAKVSFPDARIVVLASDTAETDEQLRAILNDIRDRKYDIIIGTQIIAKGHHFPMLTCVGVIDADIGLTGGDLRAAERTYQLLHQVAGRAGRADRPGRVWLQTFYPDSKVMKALTHHDRDVFLDVEAHERESAHMPPYSRLAGIIVSGKNEQQVLDIARELGRTAPQGQGIQTFGPAEAPFYRLRGNYRRRLLVRANKELNIQKAVNDWMETVKIPSTIRVYLDIDPQSFL